MPESDVSKMKVADLKRELKLRGLLTTGNKNELQDRLQTALIDGELSLEDTAISGEDLQDEFVLTDEEDEAKILGADENELLKSPTTTPTAAPDLTKPLLATADDEDVDEDAVLQSPTTPSKKVVLKRKNSFITATTTTAAKEAGDTATAAGLTSKENTEPLAAKTPKMSERNPITIDGGAAAAASSESKPADAAAGAAAKVSQLSLQERLEMRAKKFGITAKAEPAAASSGETAVAGSSVASAGGDEKQIEMLKKRAERFGCVVSSKIAKLDAEEKLLKRKQRFGGGGAAGGAAADAAADSTTTPSPLNDVWAEKARLRLERFKSTAAADASVDAPAAIVVSTKTPVEAPAADPVTAADAAK